MYFDDLSPYEYYDPDKTKERVRAFFGFPAATEIILLNVGWLDDATKPFRTGALDAQVIDTVANLCARRPSCNMMRGFQVCRLCYPDSYNIDMMRERHGSQEIPVGNGEVWFQGVPQDKASNVVTVYAAPTMLLHYIKTHSYLPPDEALDALLAR